MVDMTLENIDEVVTEACDELPGFDSTLAVRCLAFASAPPSPVVAKLYRLGYS